MLSWPSPNGSVRIVAPSCCLQQSRPWVRCNHAGLEEKPGTNSLPQPRYGQLSPVFEPEAFFCRNCPQCCRVCEGQLLVPLGRELKKRHAKLFLRFRPAPVRRSVPSAEETCFTWGVPGFEIAARCWCVRRAGSKDAHGCFSLTTLRRHSSLSRHPPPFARRPLTAQDPGRPHPLAVWTARAAPRALRPPCCGPSSTFALAHVCVHTGQLK